MRRVLLGTVLLVLAAIVVIAIALRPPTPPDRQLFVGARVITMDPQRPFAEAVYVEAERIVAVGSLAEVEARAGADAPRIDLAGKTLLPGFIDAHGHYPGSGLVTQAVDLNSPPIGTIESIDGVIAKLKARAAETPKGEWVRGFGFDDTLVGEKRHLTRNDLDGVSTEHPIMVTHVSGHIVSANSQALEAAGIDRDTPNPEGGIIQKDEGGEPNGILDETARLGTIELAFDFSLFDFLEMVDYASKEYASQGVTTAQAGLAEGPMFDGLWLASRLQRIPFRLMIWPAQESGLAIAAGEFATDRFQGPMLEIGAVKLVADGSIQGYTGYLSRPYHVPHKGDVNYRGYPTMKPEELTEVVMKLHESGLQIAIHGNGDAAIDDILDAVAAAQKSSPNDDPRHIVIHAQMARPDQLDRMLELGITPSYFIAHTYYWGDRHRDIFMGPERASRMSPAATSRAKGLRFSIHLDTPVVPMDPLMLVWTAVNRISTGGDVIGPAERISAHDALRAVTIDAAWQIFKEHDRGSIEPGKFADLVVLSGNPLEDPAGIRDLEVERTLVAGRTIYSR